MLNYLVLAWAGPEIALSVFFSAAPLASNPAMHWPLITFDAAEIASILGPNLSGRKAPADHAVGSADTAYEFQINEGCHTLS